MKMKTDEIIMFGIIVIIVIIVISLLGVCYKLVTGSREDDLWLKSHNCLPEETFVTFQDDENVAVCAYKDNDYKITYRQALSHRQ